MSTTILLSDYDTLSFRLIGGLLKRKRKIDFNELQVRYVDILYRNGENKAIKSMYLKGGFTKIRKEAEQKIKDHYAPSHGKTNSSYDIRDIYFRLSSAYNISREALPYLLQMEIQEQLNLLRCNEKTLEIYNASSNKKQKTICLCDTILPEHELIRYLYENSIPQPDQLYVLNLNHSRGAAIELWQYIHSRENGKVIHVDEEPNSLLRPIHHIETKSPEQLNVTIDPQEISRVKWLSFFTFTPKVAKRYVKIIRPLIRN